MQRRSAARLAFPALSLAAAALLPAARAAAAAPGVVIYSPNMRVSSLAGRPDTDQVEFPGGRRMSVGTLRRLEAIAPKLRAPGMFRLPPALNARPAATGQRLSNSADLAAALRRSNSDTVQLPSGRLVTVGQIRFVQPRVEKALGRSLTAVPRRPGLSGPAIKVSGATTADEWKAIFRKPDGTALESPDGTRITVGELKHALQTSLAAGARN
jgi:hypothetical protein